MTTKDRLHQLVDRLPESALDDAKRFLERLQAADDPVLQAFMNAPVDNEPLTAEEIAGIEEAKAELARGEGVPWEVARARLLRQG